MDWVLIMKVIDNIADLKKLFENGKHIRDFVIKDISFSTEDDTIHLFPEDGNTLDNCIISNCSFTDLNGSSSGVHFNVDERITILGCTFYVPITQISPIIYSDYEINIRDSKFEDAIYLPHSYSSLSFVNSETPMLNYEHFDGNFTAINSTVGSMYLKSEYLTISEDSLITFIKSKVGSVNFAHLISIEGCGKDSGILNMLFDRNSQVNCTKITFSECDLSGKEIYEINSRAGVVFEKCNMHDVDFSKFQRSINYDTGMAIRNNCTGVDTINFGDKSKVAIRNDAIATRVTFFK